MMATACYNSSNKLSLWSAETGYEVEVEITDLLSVTPLNEEILATGCTASSWVRTKKGDHKCCAYVVEILEQMFQKCLTEDEMRYLEKFSFLKINSQNEVNYFMEPKKDEPNDTVNHPSHYTWLKEKCGIEVIDITRHLDFCTGNAVKYLLRAGHKSEVGISNLEKTIEDLRKAVWYIEDKIGALKLQQIKENNE